MAGASGVDHKEFVRHGDSDVWMEQYVMNKSGDAMVHCYRSLRLGRVVRSEPPSGASRILYLDELSRVAIESLAIPEKKQPKPDTPKKQRKPFQWDMLFTSLFRKGKMI